MSVYNLLVALRDCVGASLSSPVPANAPDRLFVAPGGPPAWDDCCNGQAWVRLVSVEPVTSTCGVVGWTLTVAAGILRCAATVDDRGLAPSVLQLEDDSEGVLSDMEDVLRGLQCCSAVDGVEPVQWIPMGPEGGCVGGEWTVRVRVDRI